VEKSTWWGNGEELPDKTAEEIQREIDEELTYVVRLAREAERGKRHNGLYDDSVCRKMSLGMALPRGDTTQSSIHGAQEQRVERDYDYYGPYYD
jgi:hypothetical protein